MSRFIVATMVHDETRRTVECKGRVAQRLEHLATVGLKDIVTRFQERGGDFPGKHARYTLLDRVRVHADGEERGAA